MQIAHVALWASDLEALRELYQRYFDAKASEKYVNPRKGFASYFLEFAAGPPLEIMSRADVSSLDDGAPRAEVCGYAHLAMSVDSQAKVDELTVRLVADGFQLVDGPSRTGDGYYESVIADPEGNRVEITV